MRKLITKDIIEYMLISAGVNLLVATLAIFVFGVAYAVDDDPSMSYIAYGIYADPSARIMFSNVIFGEIIRQLFKIKSTINWQVALYFVGLCAGGFMSLFEILKTHRNKIILLWILFVSCFFYTGFCNITFTMVAAYVCAQGFLAFFLAIKDNDKICMIVSGLVIFFASLLRFLSVMAVSMIISVAWFLIVIFEYVKSEDTDIRKRIKTLANKYMVPFVILFVILLAGFGIDRIAYSYSDWAEYDRYTNLRSDILDNASIIVSDDYERQEELGITPAMAESLKEWKFNDPDIFTTELFEKILEISLDLRAKIYPHPFKDMWFSVWGLIKNNFIFQTGMILLLMLNVICVCKNKKFTLKNLCLIATLFPFLMQVFIYCYMGRYVDAVTKTFPPRVIDMALMGFWMGFILVEVCCEDKKDIAEEKWEVTARTGAIFAVFLFSVFIQFNENYKLKGFSLKSESMIEEAYSYLNDGHIYVLDWKAYQTFMDEYRCWQNPPQGYLKNVTFIGGCEIKYPLLVEKEKALGISNPYKALYEKENVYYVATEYPEIELNYLRDVYDESIECELVENYDTLDVYNFVKK